MTTARLFSVLLHRDARRFGSFFSGVINLRLRAENPSFPVAGEKSWEKPIRRGQ